MVCAGPGNRFAWLLEVAAREMHALDGDALWRDELARAKHWLSTRKGRRDARQAAILARVNAHVHFAHAQQRQRELEADEAEAGGDSDGALPDADLSLDFLGSVDAEDIKSLLAAEAATIAEVQQEQVPVQEEKPLAMPTHLLAKHSPPKLYASIAKSAHLQPKFVMRLPPQAAKTVSVTALASVALEEDAGVAELMNELELDISDVDHHLPPAQVSSKSEADEEESKSEEPAQLTAAAAAKPPSAMDDLARLVFQTTSVLAKKGRNVIREASDESDGVEKPRKRASADPDAVADEMRGWVTGYRDPEVLRRKEAMSRRPRRPTSRFGASSVEEQLSIIKAAKYYAGEDVERSSESESADSTGSDFAPADDGDDRDDQASEVELLSDDYLDEERASGSHAKPKHRRLRNKHRDREKASPPLQARPVAQKQESPVANSETQRTLQFKTPVDRVPAVSHLKDDAKPSREAPKPTEGSTVQAQTSVDAPESIRAAQANSSEGVAKKSETVEAVADAKPLPKVGLSKATSEVSANAVEGSGPRALTEASLRQHTTRETLDVKESEAHAVPAEAADDVSEADTLDFDDVEEMSDEPIHEFDGPSTREDDLGFSDADDDDDKEDDETRPSVVAPNDDEYEQFFADTPLRKQKLKEQQERKAAEAASAKESTASSGDIKKAQASELKTTTAGNSVKNSTAAPAAVGGAATTAPAVVQETTGSNGLRKKTKPGTIATTTVMKGKYQQIRRSTKVIAEENPGRGKRSVAGVYGNNTESMIGVKKSRFSEPLVQGSHSSTAFTTEFLSSISEPALDRTYQRNGRPAGSSVSIEKKQLRDGGEDERYLSYGSKRASGGDKSARDRDSDDEPLSTTVRGAKAKDAVGSSKSDVQPKGWSFSSAVAANENVNLNPVAKAPEFPRDRQMDIYDALHIEDQAENGLTSRDLRDGEFKRPSAFKKVQEEREKRGISFVSRETYLENLPIPKKKKLPGQHQPQPPAKTSPAKPASENRDYSNKRSSAGRSSYTEKASHYGPSSGVEPLSAKNNSVFSKKDKSFNSKGKGRGKYDKFNSRRSYSPPSRRRADDFDNHRGGRGKDRQRRHAQSRSPSPRQNDRYKSSSEASRQRHRSASRSRSRDRDDRDRSRNTKDARDERDGRKDAPSLSTADRSASESSRKRTRSAERSDDKSLSWQPDDRADPPKNAKPQDPRTRVSTDRMLPSESVPPPGALFDEDFGSDMFISDSDNENESGGGKVPDIRLDLESVEVDARRLKRRVYVTGMTAMMSEEDLEELFAPFGIETDRETGFPAIDVFLCQRSHRPRGDACVTFLAEDGARNAAEELDAKIFRNCKIDVRVMTLPIQRLLNAQFHTPRESWKCAGADCRADVSIWNNKCGKCLRKRIFGPSRVRVADTDWVCSICFTANADRAVACSTCSASLPPTDRAQFYNS